MDQLVNLKICLLLLLVTCLTQIPFGSCADWPDCKFQCRAGDVTLERAYLGDASGNPLSTCNPGSPASAYLWIDIYNNANSERYAVILLTDIYINDVKVSSTYPSGICVLDEIPPKTTSTYSIYSFDWTCGQSIKLSNMVLSWETKSGTTCDNANRKCANRNTKCYGGTGTDIIVDRPIVADFISNTPQCCCIIAFSDKTTGGSETYTYDWNFGDGSAHSTDANPSHIYSSDGTYTVTLTATDSSGSSSTINKEVILYSLPEAEFTTNSPICLGSSITFTDMTTNGTAPYTYDWNFGDGSDRSTVRNPSHTYAASGTYTVTLTVTDSNGCTGTTSSQVVVNQTPNASFTTNSPVCLGTANTFTDTTSSGTALYTYDWNFGDGSAHVTARNPSHTYTTSGTYTGTLTVTDSNGCTGTTSSQVVVNPTTNASFTTNSPICLGTANTFTDTTSNGTAPYTYDWNFGDGSAHVTARNPNHTYTTSGTYTVTLTVTDSNGCTDTTSSQVFVNPVPNATFTTNSPVCLGTANEFTDTTSSGTAPYTYDWNFGDGSAHVTARNPNHTYTAPGTYTATLIVTDSNGCTATISKSVVVNPAVQADAGSDLSTSPKVPRTIGGFPTASSGSGSYTYMWNPSTGLDDMFAANPIASPSVTTTYTVTVTDSAGCSASDSMTLHVSSIKLRKVPSVTSATVGDTITYDYIITNTGNTTVSSLTITDDMIGTISAISPSTLSPGENAYASASYTVLDNDMPGPLVNNAIATAIDTFGLTLTSNANASVTLTQRPITPILECVRDNHDGTYTAFFGYENSRTSMATIPIGTSNRFVPDPANRGQLVDFSPGRHEYVLEIIFDGTPIQWLLGGYTAMASSSSPSCTPSNCMIVGLDLICENATTTYVADVEEVAPYSYTYSWSLNGVEIGSSNSISVSWPLYGPGYHILSLLVKSSYDDKSISRATCELIVKVIPEPDATIRIVNVV